MATRLVYHPPAKKRNTNPGEMDQTMKYGIQHIALHLSSGVHVVETTGWKPGLYTYYIYSSVEKLANGCFIKN